MAIMFRWTTASEADNAFVEVQRSRDGLRFEALGTIPGTGPSDTPRHYQFADKAPFPGLNYYRLRQVDFSGAETFFPVLAVVFSGSAGALQINPNVVSEVLNVQLPAPLAGPGELLVIDLLGRTVCKNSVTFGDQTIHLEVGSLPQGSYWLALRSGGSISVSRFVVQR
ncbi:MAG: T9SS type A sorting domain-containing protein [Haliscomenobacter sp.]|nr:T9SS type A sorting domain-containing protein [Haliscomenobacter sp.]